MVPNINIIFVPREGRARKSCNNITNQNDPESLTAKRSDFDLAGGNGLKMRYTKLKRFIETKTSMNWTNWEQMNRWTLGVSIKK